MERNIREIELEKNIKNILLNLNFDFTYKGFKYWVTAIKYVILNRLNNKEAYLEMENIYNYVALKHKSTRSKVERCMRYANERLDKNKFIEMFNYHKNKKITNLLSMSYISDKVAEVLRI